MFLHIWVDLDRVNSVFSSETLVLLNVLHSKDMTLKCAKLQRTAGRVQVTAATNLVLLGDLVTV